MSIVSHEKMAVLSRERLQEILAYDQETGVFRWRVDLTPKTKAGSVAGSLSKSRGYIGICVNRRTYFAHRLAWLYVYGEWPAQFIDRIDGDRSNNRLSNLREASRAENQQNRRINSNNSSGLKGIYFDGCTGKWRAQIKVNGKIKRLGRFSDPSEAHAAYVAAADKFFGDFARSS
jgi:hypothetical protein